MAPWAMGPGAHGPMGPWGIGLVHIDCPWPGMADPYFRIHVEYVAGNEVLLTCVTTANNK